MENLKSFFRVSMWLAVLLILLGSGSTIRAQAPTDAVGIFYIGPEDSIAKAIDRAAPYIIRVEQPDPDLAQVVVINNAPIEGSTLEYFGTQIRERRMGLVIFCGPLFPTNVEQLDALLGVSVFELSEDSIPVSVQPAELEDELQNSANWLSAPALQARTIIINPNLLRPALTDTEGNPIIQRVRGRTETQVLLVGGWLGQSHNAAWQDWAYYPYLIYRLIDDAAQMPRTLSFVDFPASPVPHNTARWGLAGMGIGLLAGTIGLYSLGRRYVFMRVTDTVTVSAPKRHSGDRLWQQAGFHRPLSGFLIFIVWGMMLLIPALSFDRSFLRTQLSNDLQVLDIWNNVGRWVALVWVLLDAGTGLAVVRYYAALHIHQPQRAFEYLRFYFWWHFLSSTAQLGLMCLLAIWGLPLGNWAHLTYYLILHALVQFPGMLQIFSIYFQASQRTDYEQALKFLSTFGVLGLQVLCLAVLPDWTWFTTAFQGGISTMVTLAIGLSSAQWLQFVAGAGLAHRLGIAWNRLMVPHFDPHVVRRSLSYGFRAVPAMLAVSLSTALQTTAIPVVQSLNRQYPLVLLFIGGFDLLTQGLYHDLMPAMAEAYHSNYKVLFRYYISQGIRTAVWFSALLCAWISIPLLFHTGGDVTIAIQSLLPFIVWGGIRWLLWLPVTILRSVDRPALGSLLVIVEQVALITLLFLLPAQTSMSEIGIYYLISLAGAGLLGWVAVARLVTTPRVYVWQSLVAPLVSALVVFQIMLWTLGNPGTVLLPLSIVELSLLAFPVFLAYSFLTALLGGWDAGTLEELSQAVHMSLLGYPLTWLLLQAVRLGARISPLHNRFPVSLRPVAMQEAELLPLTQNKSG